jgi:outer membrane protein assembly factor BamB
MDKMNRPTSNNTSPAKALTATALLLSVLAGPSLAADIHSWPTFGGPHRNWISDEAGWQAKWSNEGPKKLWQQSVGIGFSSFSVADGRVYTVGYEGEKDTVYCFNAETGEVIWKYSYPAPLLDKYYEGGPGGTPTIDGARVYTVSKVGDFFCLDAATGKEIWKKDLKKEIGAQLPEWAFAGSALIEGQMVILDMGKVVAFDKEKGNIIWQTEDYGSAYSSPIAFDLEGTRCIAVLPNFGLVVVDAKTGKEICKSPWETKYGVNAATPVVIGDKIFVSSGYDAGCTLVDVAGKKANVLWKNENMRNHFTSSIAWKGYIYGFDESVLTCLDVKTGEPKWNQEDLGKGSLMIADGTLIVLSEKGELVTAEPSPEGFKEISRAQVLGGKCWTVPVLANGRIYCRNAKGDVVCVDVKGS